MQDVARIGIAVNEKQRASVFLGHDAAVFAGGGGAGPLPVLLLADRLPVLLLADW